MVRAIKQEITIQSPGRLEISSPELIYGARAEVIVILEESKPKRRFDLRRIIGTGKGCYSSPDEVDAFLRGERDEWE